MSLYTELKEKLQSLYPEVETDIFKKSDGLIRISETKELVIVEFAENGIEADNMLFDDVGLYPKDEVRLEEILVDLEIS